MRGQPVAPRAAVEAVVASVRAELEPSREEEDRVRAAAARVLDAARREAERLGFEARPVLVGSVAKGTWLPGSRDIDVFLLFPPDLGREALRERGLSLGRATVAYLGGRATVAYAEHPYVKGEVDGFKIDLVPAFEVSAASERISSVGRTPFHTEYMLRRLDDRLRGEVRLLKRLCRGCELYGSDLRTEGLSGFLCEVLVVWAGSFVGVLEAASGWSAPVLIDVEGHRDGAVEFREPLVAVDPVDRRRNVAAALSAENLALFSRAAADFLSRPDRSFFFPPQVPDLSWGGASDLLGGDRLAIVAFQAPELVPDLLWPQLRRLGRALVTLLGQEGFAVRSWRAWSLDGGPAVVAMRCSTWELAPTRVHWGPAVDAPERHQRAFAEKHRAAAPRVSGGRWQVVLRRESTTVDALLAGALSVGEGALVGRGCPRSLARPLASSGRVLCGDGARELFDASGELRRLIHAWLAARSRWEWGGASQPPRSERPTEGSAGASPTPR